MFKEFPDDDAKIDDFLNEFRQKISDHNIETIEEKKEESSQAFNNLDKTCEAILADLKVPQDSREIDILFFFYKTFPFVRVRNKNRF